MNQKFALFAMTLLSTALSIVLLVRLAQVKEDCLEAERARDEAYKETQTLRASIAQGWPVQF